VKFWDASAIVPLLVAEESTRRLQALAAKDSAMLVWWGSAVECISALARLERDGALSSPAMTLALQRLQQLSAGWHEIDPSDEIRETAARFLRVHPLRAADALQLAAAFAAAERRPASLEIVTLDDRLANAARKEGFALLDGTEVEREVASGSYQATCLRSI
jgi:predicted nucleic acid-binding protein